MAQGLQTGGQSQHHHAQITRKRQQHFPHAFRLSCRGLCHGRSLPCSAGGALCDTRHALKAHQFGGLYRQICKTISEGFGNDFVGFIQVFAGIDQVTCGLHGL